MDYAAHYDRLIARARSRQLDGYRERHHVVPRCLGGTNAKSNIVELTAEEHYVAHQLLVKMCPTNRRLAHAMAFLSTRAGNNKMFGWLRRRRAEAISQEGKGRRPSEEARAKMRAARARRVFTAEMRANLSAALKGRKKSAEHKAKHAAALRGRKLPAEQVERLRQFVLEGRSALSPRWGNTYWVGRTHSEESKARISAAKRGKPLSPEHRERSAALLRLNAPCGPMPQSTKDKIAAAKRGKKLSQEHRAKLSAAHQKRLYGEPTHG